MNLSNVYVKKADRRNASTTGLVIKHCITAEDDFGFVARLYKAHS